MATTVAITKFSGQIYNTFPHFSEFPSTIETTAMFFLSLSLSQEQNNPRRGSKENYKVSSTLKLTQFYYFISIYLFIFFLVVFCFCFCFYFFVFVFVFFLRGRWSGVCKINGPFTRNSTKKNAHCNHNT